MITQFYYAAQPTAAYYEFPVFIFTINNITTF